MNPFNLKYPQPAEGTVQLHLGWDKQLQEFTLSYSDGGLLFCGEGHTAKQLSNLALYQLGVLEVRWEFDARDVPVERQ